MLFKEATIEQDRCIYQSTEKEGNTRGKSRIIVLLLNDQVNEED
jgi:hypothetical protein